MARIEVRIAGFGGQGVVLAGVLLGTAAALYDGKHAVQTQTYGAAARGGAARSDVIVDDAPIVYPQVIRPGIMAVFTTVALKKYRGDLRPEALLIIDENLVTAPEGTDFRVFAVPATDLAQRELGRGIVANMVMLGFLAGVTGIVSTEALKSAIRHGVPLGTETLNLDAFECGLARAITT